MANRRYRKDWAPPVGSDLNAWMDALGIVAAFPMNEGAGSVLVNYGLAVFAGTLSATTWAQSLKNSVLSFNGTSSKVTTTYKFPGTSGAWWFSFWFNTTSAGGAATNCVVAGGSSTTGAQLAIGVESGVVELRFSGGNTVAAGSGFNDGKWHHCFVAWAPGATAAGVIAYVDGKKQTTSTGGSTVIALASTNPLQFGWNVSNGAAFYSGTLKHFLMGNKTVPESLGQRLFADPYFMYRPAQRRMMRSPSSTARGLLLRRRKLVMAQ